jgi:hypothetical protein
MDTSQGLDSDQREEPRDTFLKEPREWLSVFKKLRTFWATRQGVGDPAQLKRMVETSSDEFMGPWKFNLYKVALVVSPSILATKAFNFVAPLPPKPPNPLIPEVTARAFELLSSVQEVAQPFLFPALILVSSSIAARAALLKQDRTPDGIRRSRNLFLYIDGAIGLVPQAGLTLSLTLAIAFSSRNLGPATLWSIVSTLVFLYWTGFPTFVKLTKMMLSGNGYNPGRARFLGLGKNATNPLYNTFQVKVAVYGLLIVWPLLIASFLAEYGASYLIALFQIWARHKIGVS